MKPIQEYSDIEVAKFRDTILTSDKPAVFRGLVRHWPAITAATASAEEFCAYLRQFDCGGSATTFVAEPSANGRFWYRPDMRGLNFEQIKEPLAAALTRILSQLDSPLPLAVYTGSVPIRETIPGFEPANRIDVFGAAVAPRIWIGNAVTVSTHYDQSDNVACVVAGRRQFTLFPPEQVTNLYVGPLEFNFTGQPVSMVSVREPDLERYPRFRNALDAGMQAELGPGDAIFIPYMWWHHVESLEPFNVLVNYWWDDGRAWLGSPFEAMILGLLTIGDLPPEKRKIWKTYFDYYVFRSDGHHPAEHMPPEQRGIMSPPTPELAKFVKSWLMKVLSR